MVRLCMLALCACDVGSVVALPEVSPQRLVAVGPHVTAFDPLGYPVFAETAYTTFLYEWNLGELTSIDAWFAGFSNDRHVHATPTYRDGRLIAVESVCAGVCRGGARRDELAYTADGALVRWARTWSGSPTIAHRYMYNALAQLARVETTSAEWPAPQVDLIYYTDLGCPFRIATEHAAVDYAYDADGRLATMLYFTSQPFPVRYDDGGNIIRFDSVDDDLVYEQAPARGLDQWPGHLHGGFAYGFGMHGELFRLDGSCDPTLTAQSAIAAMVIPDLLSGP